MTTLRWAAPTCTVGQISTQPMATGIVPNGAGNSQAGIPVQDCSSNISYVFLIAVGAVMVAVHDYVSKKKGRR